jgi:hypothetical protein
LEGFAVGCNNDVVSDVCSICLSPLQQERQIAWTMPNAYLLPICPNQMTILITQQIVEMTIPVAQRHHGVWIIFWLCPDIHSCRFDFMQRRFSQDFLKLRPLCQRACCLTGKLACARHR